MPGMSWFQLKFISAANLKISVFPFRTNDFPLFSFKHEQVKLSENAYEESYFLFVTKSVDGIHRSRSYCLETDSDYGNGKREQTR